MQLLELPELMIQQVFEFLSYDEVAKSRIICKKFDKICQRILNHGFYKMTKRHSENLKAIKAKLPRRESERRNHPLARVSDILTCIETRLSMLSMTYLKYMEMDLCCFIPGKVIDEVFSILRLIETTTASKQLRAHEVLQELRDISSMAIEHFDEKIAVGIKKTLYNLKTPQVPSSLLATSTLLATPDLIVDPSTLVHSSSSSSTSSSATAGNSQLLTLKITQSHSHSHDSDACSNSTYEKTLLNLEKKYLKTLNRQSTMIKKQSKQITKLALNMKYMKRRLDESEIKYRELSANVSHYIPSTSNDTARGRTTRSGTTALILKRRLNQK